MQKSRTSKHKDKDIVIITLSLSLRNARWGQTSEVYRVRLEMDKNTYTQIPRTFKVTYMFPMYTG